MRITEQVQHPSGLVVGVPEGFTAKPTEEGFIIEPQGDKNLKVRHPVAVYVSVIKGKSVAQDSSLQTKTLDGKTIRYRIDKSDGGSGGETYSLEAYEDAPSGYIQYSQATQSEYGEPEFAACWSVIGATKLNGMNQS